MSLKRIIATILFTAVIYLGAFSENSAVVIYRTGNPKTDKCFLRVALSFRQLDSLPPNHAYVYSSHDGGTVNINCRVENYAGWPDHSMSISLVDKDTSFIRTEIKRDAFGNPVVKMKLVSRAEAWTDLQSVGHNFLFANDLEANKSTFSEERKMGTGFLISKKGFFITCYHVIENASSIKVKNLNGDKNADCKATVIFKDKKNDLAILKVVDPVPMLDSIPFTIKTGNSDLGEKVLVFGYPMTNSMGDDVKLTNGIISSVNGFEGDVNSYQLSAPVQPGNSGGPVFDEKGNLIAVINAKHSLAENATYCIKSPYLLNLLQNIPDYKSECSSSELWKLTMTDQAKILQRLVYIIEVK